MNDQEKSIRSERLRIGVSEVRMHHMPRWLILRLLKLRREGGLVVDSFYTLDTSEYSGQLLMERALNQYATHAGRLMDHWGTTTLASGERAFVLEPYADIHGEWRAGLESLAGHLDCRLLVAMESWWFPGNTIRIAFIPNGA